jgi:hypothetical protein
VPSWFSECSLCTLVWHAPARRKKKASPKTAVAEPERNPHNCPISRSGWRRDYSRRLVRQQAVAVLGRRNELRSVAYSPAGLRTLGWPGDFRPLPPREPACETSVQPVREIAIYPFLTGADFCHPISAPLSQDNVTAFRARTRLCDYWPPHPAAPPLSACCSSAQRFAYSFIQVPSRDGLPCRSANTSPCRVRGGLECALPGTPKRKARTHRSGARFLSSSAAIGRSALNSSRCNGPIFPAGHPA